MISGAVPFEQSNRNQSSQVKLHKPQVIEASTLATGDSGKYQRQNPKLGAQSKEQRALIYQQQVGATPSPKMKKVSQKNSTGVQNINELQQLQPSKFPDFQDLNAQMIELGVTESNEGTGDANQNMQVSTSKKSRFQEDYTFANNLQSSQKEENQLTSQTKDDRLPRESRGVLDYPLRHQRSFVVVPPECIVLKNHQNQPLLYSQPITATAVEGQSKTRTGAAVVKDKSNKKSIAKQKDITSPLKHQQTFSSQTEKRLVQEEQLRLATTSPTTTDIQQNHYQLQSKLQFQQQPSQILKQKRERVFDRQTHQLINNDHPNLNQNKSKSGSNKQKQLESVNEKNKAKATTIEIGDKTQRAFDEYEAQLWVPRDSSFEPKSVTTRGTNSNPESRLSIVTPKIEIVESNIAQTQLVRQKFTSGHFGSKTVDLKDGGLPEKSDQMYPSMRDIGEKVDSEGNSLRSSKSAKKRTSLRYHPTNFRQMQDQHAWQMQHQRMATLDEYDLRRFERSTGASGIFSSKNSKQHTDNKDFGSETEQHLENLLLSRNQKSTNQEREARNFTFARKQSERQLKSLNSLNQSQKLETPKVQQNVPNIAIEYKKDQKCDSVSIQRSFSHQQLLLPGGVQQNQHLQQHQYVQNPQDIVLSNSNALRLRHQAQQSAQVSNQIQITQKSGQTSQTHQNQNQQISRSGSQTLNQSKRELKHAFSLPSLTPGLNSKKQCGSLYQTTIMTPPSEINKQKVGLIFGGQETTNRSSDKKDQKNNFDSFPILNPKSPHKFQLLDQQNNHQSSQLQHLENKKSKGALESTIGQQNQIDSNQKYILQGQQSVQGNEVQKMEETTLGQFSIFNQQISPVTKQPLISKKLSQISHLKPIDEENLSAYLYFSDQKEANWPVQSNEQSNQTLENGQKFNIFGSGQAYPHELSRIDPFDCNGKNIQLGSQTDQKGKNDSLEHKILKRSKFSKVIDSEQQKFEQLGALLTLGAKEGNSQNTMETSTADKNLVQNKFLKSQAKSGPNIENNSFQYYRQSPSTQLSPNNNVQSQNNKNVMIIVDSEKQITPPNQNLNNQPQTSSVASTSRSPQPWEKVYLNAMKQIQNGSSGDQQVYENDTDRNSKVDQKDGGDFTSGAGGSISLRTLRSNLVQQSVHDPQSQRYRRQSSQIVDIQGSSQKQKEAPVKAQKFLQISASENPQKDDDTLKLQMDKKNLGDRRTEGKDDGAPFYGTKKHKNSVNLESGSHYFETFDAMVKNDPKMSKAYRMLQQKNLQIELDSTANTKKNGQNQNEQHPPIQGSPSTRKRVYYVVTKDSIKMPTLEGTRSGKSQDATQKNSNFDQQELGSDSRRRQVIRKRKIISQESVQGKQLKQMFNSRNHAEVSIQNAQNQATYGSTEGQQQKQLVVGFSDPKFREINSLSSLQSKKNFDRQNLQKIEESQNSNPLQSLKVSDSENGFGQFDQQKISKRNVQTDRHQNKRLQNNLNTILNQKDASSLGLGELRLGGPQTHKNITISRKRLFQTQNDIEASVGENKVDYIQEYSKRKDFLTYQKDQRTINQNRGGGFSSSNSPAMIDMKKVGSNLDTYGANQKDSRSRVVDRSGKNSSNLESKTIRTKNGVKMTSSIKVEGDQSGGAATRIHTEKSKSTLPGVQTQRVQSKSSKIKLDKGKNKAHTSKNNNRLSRQQTQKVDLYKQYRSEKLDKEDLTTNQTKNGGQQRYKELKIGRHQEFSRKLSD